MMALTIIGSLFEYGRPTAVLRRVAGVESRTPGAPRASPVLANSVQAGRLKVLMAKRLDGDLSKMEIDDEDVDIDKSSLGTSEVPSPTSAEPELPAVLQFAMELTFVMLSHTLRNPVRRASEYATPTLNPYNTVILTFLPTVLRDQSAGAAIERPSFLSNNPAATSSASTRRLARGAAFSWRIGAFAAWAGAARRSSSAGSGRRTRTWSARSATSKSRYSTTSRSLTRRWTGSSRTRTTVRIQGTGSNQRRWVRPTCVGLRFAHDVHGHGHGARVQVRECVARELPAMLTHQRPVRGEGNAFGWVRMRFMRGAEE